MLTSEQIRNIARGIVKNFNLNEPPVDLYYIAEKLNCIIRYVKDFPLTVDGMVLPLASGEYLVLINQYIKSVRKRFTLAHELGHVYLKHYLKYGLYKSKDQQKGIIERQADVFATELLMPKHWVRKYYQEIKNIEELAQLFWVSKESMTIRLKELNLIQPDYSDLLDEIGYEKLVILSI